MFGILLVSAMALFVVWGLMVLAGFLLLDGLKACVR